MTDITEDGRLLAFRRICGDLEDESVWSFTTNIMALRARLEHAVSEAETVTSAYREAVRAAKEFRDAVKPADGRMNVVLMDQTCKALDAALARFTNITETP